MVFTDKENSIYTYASPLSIWQDIYGLHLIYGLNLQTNSQVVAQAEKVAASFAPWQVRP